MNAWKDDATYHEMLAHPALASAPRIDRVLIVGGANSGTVREVMRYVEVQEVDLVDVDEIVVDASRKQRRRTGTTWDDPRLQIHVADGAEWVNDCAASYYDVILVDGPDPAGHRRELVGSQFIKDCALALTSEGVLAIQAGSPVLQRDSHLRLVRKLRGGYREARPYYAPVSVCPGGVWSWAWASNGSAYAERIVLSRVARLEQRTYYYNRAIHLAAFSIPNHIRLALES